MPMFRFWTSDSKGNEQIAGIGTALLDGTKRSNVCDISSQGSGRPPKRRRSSLSDEGSPCQYYPDNELPEIKRARVNQNAGLLSPQSSTSMDAEELLSPHDLTPGTAIDEAKEAIHFQFGLEILLRHDELRLINQELAKCQVALEQLRRCHLIPYPISCPTPAQMLEVSSGNGPALPLRSGQSVPRWAPPFGVVDGPYARHYAKWLIPDPQFDGMLPEAQGLYDLSRARNPSAASAEGRATRNSLGDIASLGALKGRPVRGGAGQKLHALSSGYAQPKDKQGPCVLKRSDGQTVRLVCIDCHRWDFSSTQGFINHCRIAHRRDFKSHEEAAVHCGHPIEADDSPAGPPPDERAAGASVSPSSVHPLARNEPITEQQAYTALRSRISASLKLYHAGKLPNVKSIPGSLAASSNAKSASVSAFVGAQSTPFLSRLLQKKDFKGNLNDHVEDARTKLDEDDDFAQDEESDDPDLPSNVEGASSAVGPPRPVSQPVARAPAIMRIPGRGIVSPVPLPVIPHSAGNKARAPHLGLPAVPQATIGKQAEAMRHGDDEDDDEMDIDLSPNTMASNNAPSLVSDDGDYDDSCDGSSSETGDDAMETESVSDIAEINIAGDCEEPEIPRGHHRTNSGSAVKLRKDESKHVTFVSPIPGNAANVKGRRKQNA